MSLGLPTFDHGLTLNSIGESNLNLDRRQPSEGLVIRAYKTVYTSEILSRRSTKMR